MVAFLIFTSFTNNEIFGPPSFSNQVIDDGTVANIEEGQIPYDVEFLYIEEVHYSSDDNFLNVVFKMHGPFDYYTTDQIRYGLLINSDTRLDSGIGGYDYRYQVKWIGDGNWIEEYEELPTFKYEPISISNSSILNVFDNENKLVQMQIDLKKIKSPDFYNIIFFAEGTDTSQSYLVQDFTSLAVIPPHKFSISTIPDPLKFVPSSKDIFFIKVFSEIQGDPEIFYSVTQEESDDFQITEIGGNSFIFQDGIAQIPIKIEISDEAKVGFHPLQLTLKPWHNYYKESDVDLIPDALIKNSFFRNRVIDSEFSMGFGIGTPAEFWTPSLIAQASLVVVTAILVGITLWSSWKTSKHTETQLELTQKELRAKMKPLLEFEDTKTFMKKASDKPFVMYRCKIKNSGVVPARKITVHVRESNNDQIAHLVKERKDFFQTSRPIGTIQPSGHIDFSHDVLWEDGKKTTKLVIWFEYSFLENEKEESIAVLFIKPGLTTVRHLWYVNQDIEEATKRWNDEKEGKISAGV